MALIKVCALSLLSGGLDSVLAVRVLQEQGVEVKGIAFVSLFFGAMRAKAAAKALNIDLIVEDISQKHFEMLKSPPHGYGRHMNPCIDCHAMMCRRAGLKMKEEGFDFVSTGEVLGERPMSQNMDALKIVERESGIEGYLLRPLSAKLLLPTIPEGDGRVDRNKLFEIEGRSRRPQMELVKRYGIASYEQPAGGCLLTDPEFSKRLRELLNHNPKAGARDVELLKCGRHFRFESGAKLVVGRNEKDNAEIESLAEGGDSLIYPSIVPGPTCLLIDITSISNVDLELAMKICAAHCDRSDEAIELICRSNQGEEKSKILQEEKNLFAKWRIN